MSSKNKNLKIFHSKIKKIIDPAINKVLLSSVDRKYHNIVKYQVAAGGKRLRPLLAILCCYMMNGKLKDVLYPAISLEIMHNYTLIVDDMVDYGKLRRGKPTAWKKFGRGVTECIVIDYAVSAFDLPADQKHKEKINKIFIETLKAMTNGQILDILLEQGGRKDENYVIKNKYSKIDFKKYSELANKKTASLFSASCEIGGICANAKENEIKLLRNFGHNLGMAFQIQDDILDMFGDEKKFGKKIGKDIEERKLGNVVMLLAMRDFSGKDKKVFLNILRKKKIKNIDIEEGIALIKKTKAIERAHKLGINYINKAKRSLASLPKNEWSRILGELTDYLVARKV